MKRGLLFAILLGSLLRAGGGLLADDGKKDAVSPSVIGVQIQFWTGLGGAFYQSDLEDRFYRDDLVRGHQDSGGPRRLHPSRRAFARLRIAYRGSAEAP